MEGGKEEGERERENENIFVSLICSSNGHNRLDRVRLNSGTCNSIHVSYMGGSGPSIPTVICAFSRTLVGSWIESEEVGN